MPPDKACATASFILLEDRERYKDSKVDKDRRVKTVSGLIRKSVRGQGGWRLVQPLM